MIPSRHRQYGVAFAVIEKIITGERRLIGRWPWKWPGR
jgi:hypothetical protein